MPETGIPQDEEARGLLRKIVEGQAYRQLMLAHIRGHGVRFLPDLEDKIDAADSMQLALRQFREVQRLYGALSGGDLLSAVRGRMERIPFPASRLELAMCLFLCERVARHALQTYVDSSAGDLAAIARTRLDALSTGAATIDPAFVEFCAEASNRPHAQQLFNRWLSICLLSLGRPDSAGDARAIALGLRARAVGEIVADFLEGLGPFLAACSLALPDAETLGLELPRDWAARVARLQPTEGARP